jgi:hypothetical protein
MVIAILIGCDGGDMPVEKVNLRSLKEVPKESWEKLSNKKIYFGHQSVGFNIMEGVEEIVQENPEIRLKVVETKNVDDFDTGIFGHSRIGKNHEPLSKIIGFEQLLEGGLGDKADIAFIKFCFVDVDQDTDVENLFKEYKNAIEKMEAKFPETVVLRVTVPLIRRENIGITGRIKKVFGAKFFFDDENNIARNRFNQLLRDEYGSRENFFDLAKVESVRPDGSRASFMKDGERFYHLVPEYTPDAGHLNNEGRKRAAEQLLIVLAKLAD